MFNPDGTSQDTIEDILDEDFFDISLDLPTGDLEILADADETNPREVAKMYAYGIGTEQDDALAIYYYKKFNPSANDIDCVKYFAEHAYDVELWFHLLEQAADANDKWRFYWLKQAADLGDIESCREVAKMYDYGRGTERNDANAIEYYKKVADAGDIKACLELAERYTYGRGSERDDKKAFEYYKKAADLGDIESCRRVATMYAYGRGTAQDEIKAIEYCKKFNPVASKIDCMKFFAANANLSFDWYKKAADLGDIESYLTVAKMYAYGLGVEQNDANAIEYYQKYNSVSKIDCTKYFAENSPNDKWRLHWLRQAADLGDIESRRKVAKMDEDNYRDDYNFLEVALKYAYGDGVEQDDALAIYYYKKDNPDATVDEYTRFFDINSPNYKWRLHWYEKAAEIGYKEYYVQAATLCRNSVLPEPLTFKYYKKAADMGDRESCREVAKMYAYGDGTAQNDDQAIFYHRKYEPYPDDDIFRMIYFATSTKDTKLRLHWYEKAINAGDTYSYREVAKLYADSRNSQKAFQYFKKAADAGDNESLLEVAQMYAYGIGTAQNDDQAIFYLQKFNSIGDADCIKYFIKNSPNDKWRLHWKRKA